MGIINRDEALVHSNVGGATSPSSPPLLAVRVSAPAVSDGAAVDFASLLQQAYAEKQGNVAATSIAANLPQSVTSTSLQVPAAAVSLPALAPVGRACYTHGAMVQLMLERPDYTHAMLCAHFARPASWLAAVLASEAFQQALDPYRHLIVDPSLTASLQERYKALAIRTSNVMMDKLNDEKVTDFMVLKSGEIAMKALGMGTKSEAAPPPAAAPAATDTLAERLMAALDRRDNARTIDANSAEDADEDSPHGNV